jgi:hypothetical protein
MTSYFLGHDASSGKPFGIPPWSFDTHWHLIGATGKGKTTALHTLLHELLLDPIERPCVVIIDRMGNLSFDLLRWIASDFCTDDVRDRLVFIEPSREDVVIGFNPLLFDTLAHGYYKVAQASEIILKGWASQNLAEMPRLSRWLFNSFFACAVLGLTISDSVHLLLPGSPFHQGLLDALPPRLRIEWQELLRTHSGEVGRILESARNRLKPFYESPILQHMFGTTRNHLDMRRFMAEGKVVVLNLSPRNRIPGQIADAIGGLVLNEVLATARSLPIEVRHPTYLILDEFQRFIGPDIEAAIPEVRQLGIKLVLSHQSLSQLKQGDHDLTSMIFQAQSRMIFGVQGEDADILAHELASFDFDPMKIKDEFYSTRQRISGHRVAELSSWSDTQAAADNWVRNYADGWQRGETRVQAMKRSEHLNKSAVQGHAEGGSNTNSSTKGRHEQLVPIHEEFFERANTVYHTFDEDRHVWAGAVRRLKTGQALIRVVDDATLHRINVKRSAPGHLALDPATILRECPEVLDDYYRLIERNFQSEWFTSPEVVKAETQARIERLLGIASNPQGAITVPSSSTTDNPFS